MKEERNYVSVGEMYKCGHCEPENYQIIPINMCSCKCHTDENIEELTKRIFN